MKHVRALQFKTLVWQVETVMGGREGMHLSSLRTDTPRSPKWCRVKQMERLPVSGETHDKPQLTGEGLSHATSEVFEIVMFVSFESSRPTICECERDRVRYFLNGSEPAELSALPLELSYVFLRRPFGGPVD